MTTHKDKKGKPHAIDLIEMLENKFSDPEYAIAYLQETLEDKEFDLFFAALGDIAKVRGMKQLAESTGLNRESLYRMLSEKGNPTFKNVFDVLSELGFKLDISQRGSQIERVFHFPRVPIEATVGKIRVAAGSKFTVIENMEAGHATGFHLPKNPGEIIFGGRVKEQCNKALGKTSAQTQDLALAA